jgi:hypothetical protein
MDLENKTAQQPSHGAHRKPQNVSTKSALYSSHSRHRVTVKRELRHSERGRMQRCDRGRCRQLGNLG